MAVIAINKISDKVQAKYLPGAKVPSVVIAAEMQMFPIDQVITRGWPLLQAILKPGPKGSEDGEKGRKKKEKKEEKKKKKEMLQRDPMKGPKPGEKAKEKVADPLLLPAQNQAPEPPKALSPGPSQSPTHQSSHATLKAPVTPSKRAPSLGPGPYTSKKAKASISKSRPKMPLVAQKANFGIDVRLTPSESIKVYHPLAGPPPQSIPQASALKLIATPLNPLLDPRPRPSSDPKDHIIKGLEVQVASLELQVESIPDLELQVNSLTWVVNTLWEQVQGQLAAHSFPTSSHRSLPLLVSVSHQMQRLHLEMANSHPQSTFLALEAKGQPPISQPIHMGHPSLGPPNPYESPLSQPI
ncbi:hypothetical protein PAXRUDRAFT_17720 [Paxillus rubicundulus Ve08.2h10]|uniref:Uncharacterized protein n=1 Tax=Paxillus rubicundulus Ve08.2h10 TaxID=930991 RepID=A0A0D0D9H5_9AGAM|nr:hypothetical protein PAXRUDRAFT_17720 [Paxillus rubicundulus Ve08.2h10]